MVACGNKLCARLAHSGALQLGTMLQTPVKSMQEEVTVELPLSAVRACLGVWCEGGGGLAVLLMNVFSIRIVLR